MEKQEKNLADLFQKLSDRHSEKLEMPDFKLKDAVFSTIDATGLVADILDLFTVKFIQAQSEVIDSLPGNEYGNEKEKLLRYFEQKYQARKSSDDVAE